MAAFEILYQARRHCFYKTPSPLLRSHFHRFLSSPQPTYNSIPIKAVTYKPKEPPEAPVPTLLNNIKSDDKKKKGVYDVKDAIRLVKVKTRKEEKDTSGSLSSHLKRCYFSNSLIANASVRILSNPSLTVQKDAFNFPIPQSVRFFAAPVQVKTRKEEKDTSGPRLNNEITADVVRLVVDEGHRIVSIREAWELARSLNLDLVEVSRNAKPPVCKIMDYHKEKYKQQVKDSAKSKSELTLKKGSCKEVRFVGKIEQKDLKIKADTVKRMMERGYRVKCTAVSMGKEEEDLGAVLLRFSPLIEDVAYVESGPRVEKKQAYIVVRHVKFGPSKKGSGKKLSKTEEDACAESSDDGSCLEETTDDDDVDGITSDWRVSSANSDVFDLAGGDPKSLGSAKLRTRQSHDYSQTGGGPRNCSGEENRYRRDSSIPPKSVPNSRSDIGRPDRSNLSSHTRDIGSQFLSPEQQPCRSSFPRSPPSTSFGIFSSPPADSKENNVAAENRYKQSERFNSGSNSSASDPRGVRRPDLGRRDSQGNYGIFGESTNRSPNHKSENQR